MKGFTKIISLVAASTLLFSGCGNISAKADKPQTKDNDDIEIGLGYIGTKAFRIIKRV